MKKIILCLLLSVSLAHARGFQETGAMTEIEIHDVIELLRFVRTAKPELFEKFATSFEDVGASCKKNSLDEAQANKLADIIEIIERELPENNGDLLSKIKLAMMLGGKRYYSPKFIEKESVRQNISKFLLAVHESYAEKDFGTCTQLIAKAATARDIYSILIAAKR